MQHKSNNYWHSSYAYGTSDSWKLVENFYSYWNKRKQTHSSWSKSTIISHAKVGDIIQFKKRNGTRYSHAMFVYEKSGGTIYLSGHVSDILKRDFKKVDAKTYEMYRVIKM